MGLTSEVNFKLGSTLHFDLQISVNQGSVQLKFGMYWYRDPKPIPNFGISTVTSSAETESKQKFHLDMEKVK